MYLSLPDNGKVSWESRYESLLESYKDYAKRSEEKGYIRGFFEKEISTDLDRLIDMNHRLSDTERRALVVVFWANFNGVFDITDTPTTADYELWETNLRNLFAAAFEFCNNPCSETGQAMMKANPQLNGAYNSNA